MATLYVENIPDDLYEAIRRQAKKKRTSIAAEVTAALGTLFPTEAELAKRQEVFERLMELRSRPAPGKGPFPSAEEMIREDRER